MIKFLLTASILLFIFKAGTFSQLYQGPANGSVPSGVTQTTNNFDNWGDLSGEKLSPYVKKPRNKTDSPQLLPDWMNRITPKAPLGSNFIEDFGVKDNNDANSLILKSFQGFNDPGSYIPPDPYLAAGPTHVVGTDNGRFRIWDKTGNLLKSISADAWFSGTLSGANAFDPKVSYDQFSKRWVMVWLDQDDATNRGYYLVSVSDDSIPLGTWYNWAIKSSLFGSSESGTWSDYQGVGFDNQALYITGRQFGFTGGFYGNKLRIIDKSFLYANTAGQLPWTDIWSIRDPNLSNNIDNLRPAVMFSTASEYYFLSHSPYSTGTYVNLYKLTNPLTSPILTGVSIPVTAYPNTPLAQQLGGGMGIESGGNSFRFEPVYRDGFLWAVHATGSGTGYSRISYLKLNPVTNAAVEDASFGADPFYYFYTALSVDQNNNVIINYSRSSPNEYIGAHFTYRLASDPPNTLQPSQVIQNGKANYVKDFGSGRNRWGDYMGVWLDPSTPNNFWTITQYAETPANTWSAWVNCIRLVPFNGPTVYTLTDSLNYANSEVFTNGDTLALKIYNYGSATLTISNIQNFTNNFQITSAPSYPVNLAYQDSVTVRVRFNPQSTNLLIDSLRVSSNDATNPQKKILLRGRGFAIYPVNANVIYGVTGTAENGVLVTLNSSNGLGTTVGSTNYNQLTGLSIKPSNGQLYATYPSGLSSLLVRVNATAGDAYPLVSIPIANLRALSFDTGDVLYLAGTDGRLWKLNLTNNDTDFVGNTGIANLFGLSINPLNGQMWGVNASSNLYKINKLNGASTLVGNAGISALVDICFNQQGRLFGTSGIGSNISKLCNVDTLTGHADTIGTTGKKGINGIAINTHPIGIQPISSQIPETFNLNQNFPNPFNPTTSIRFDLPKRSAVKIEIFDILGRSIGEIVNETLDAGRFEVKWDASNYASGIYYYRIEAADFVQTRKMVLLK